MPRASNAATVTVPGFTQYKTSIAQTNGTPFYVSIWLGTELRESAPVVTWDGTLA